MGYSGNLILCRGYYACRNGNEQVLGALASKIAVH